MNVSINKVNMIVPSVPNDVFKLISNIEVYYRFLPIKNIVIIGNQEVGELIKGKQGVSFIDETTIIDVKHVRDVVLQCGGNNAAGRTGWYVQQFLKMGYAKLCEDKYYLVWDSDTIPLRPITLFSSADTPYLDYKTEYHKPYFDTLIKLLPDCKKQIKGSFIAEHMLIQTEFMLELLTEIENNTSLTGKSFEEKIIHAINPADIPYSGFSEFETYGTYVYKRHAANVSLREWKSLRGGGLFFKGSTEVTEDCRIWLSENYNAISFEKWHSLSVFSGFARSESIRQYPSSVLECFSRFLWEIFKDGKSIVIEDKETESEFKRLRQ